MRIMLLKDQSAPSSKGKQKVISTQLGPEKAPVIPFRNMPSNDY